MPSFERGPKAKSPDGETYNVSQPKKFVEEVEKKPAVAKAFREGARNRAEDIFESGHLKEKIHSGERVLYIGAGTGHVAQYIEEQTGAKAVKVDLADLRTADTKDAKFVQGNARRLPFKDASVDVVCLFDILHHTENQEEILAEAKRVLKPGGRCLLLEDTVPEAYETGAKAKKWLVGKMDDAFNRQPAGVNPHNYHSISDWEIKFHQAGFAVRPDDTQSWHWGLRDFLPGNDRSKRPDRPTIARSFQSTLFEIVKPESEEKK